MSVNVFPTLYLAKGYIGPVAIDVTWSDGSPRTMTGVTGTFTVYSVPPVNGAGGTTLFAAKNLSIPGSPVNRATVTMQAGDLATPGTYYAELRLVEGGVTDVQIGQVMIEGR